jgi:alpha-tubulin suppressor-like RCC1 family protein
MKMIPGSRRRHYLARVSTFLIVVAFIAGMVACGGGVIEYDLIITSSAGGSVTTPGEGTFTYDEGDVVNLVATSDAGYEFANWTGDVSTIADVDAAATTITMNEDYSIMANFVALYDLTIDSTGPGEASSPGEGTFTYPDGTVVDLVATPDTGCQFVNWTGDVSTIADVNAATTTVTTNGHYIITANFEYIPMVAAGGYHTVGLKSDGTVIAVGDNFHRQCDVSGWTGIVQIAAGDWHTVGLRDDGTVVAAGPPGATGSPMSHSYGQCETGNWTGIVQVATGAAHTVGLKTDGTVVAVGCAGPFADDGQCETGNWTGIVQVAAGAAHTVGLKTDGTVVAVGSNFYGQCNVSGWTGIVQVAAGQLHTLGLKNDGTVVAVGQNDDGQCNVGGWIDIAQIAAGGWYTVGLKNDGTVVAVGSNDYGQCNVSTWTDIVQVAAGQLHTLGLKNDGTVVAAGRNDGGQCNVGGWMLK